MNWGPALYNTLGQGNKTMAQFSRRTILAASDFLDGMGHSHITRFLLEHGLENAIADGSMRNRANFLAQYLITNPEAEQEDGQNLVDAVVEDLVGRAIARCTQYGAFDYDRFREWFPSLHRALERDGFTVEGGQLRRILPQALNLPEAQDEVQQLLARFALGTPAGHLEQAITAHSRGDWAAANAQLRAFAESLFDEIAERLNVGGSSLPPAGHQRRQWLAQLQPPFLTLALNEWVGNGTGFLEGFFRRLHPHGAHPGLSDEEDSTFRLHLVFLVARLLLKRLSERVH